MNRPLLWVTVSALLMIPVPGCAYQIYVRGVAEPEVGSELASGASIAIQVDPGSPDSDLRRATPGKIEKLLAEQGYNLASPEEADLLLFYDYERKGMMHKIVLEPSGGPATGIRSVRAEPPYNHSLVIRVVDGKEYRNQKKTKVYWAGEAVLNNSHTGGPKVLDLLLVAAFDHFPRDTKKTVRVSLTLENDRSRRLRH